MEICGTTRRKARRGTPDTLSKESTCPLFAAMNRSRSSRGSDRRGAVLGSVSARNICEKVDFAEDPARLLTPKVDMARGGAQSGDQPRYDQHEVGIGLNVKERS